MALLSGDSSVRSQVLPSVWVGYTLPRSDIMGEELPFRGMISTKEKVPQEWMDEMFGTFQNGSLVNFYDRYLGRTLTTHNHEQILLKANEILKKDLPELTLPDDRLMAMAAVDMAHNADEYGHHLFQTACFLKEQNQLPKECRFMFWRKINPALYEEKELFETVQKSLSEPTKKIPQVWAQEAFYKWMYTDDFSLYRPSMEKMATLEFILAKDGMIFLERAVQNYIHEHREPAYRHRPRPRRCVWRENRE